MPEREFNIHGKGLDAEEEKKVQRSLRSWYDYGRKPYKKEIEKSEVDLLFINKINSFLNQEFKRLGIKQRPARITPQRFHFLDSESFNEVHGSESDGADVTGSFYDKRFEIIINADKLTRGQKLRSMLHESIHAVSFRKFWVDTKRKKIEASRSGYEVFNQQDMHEHFRGFDEAVTEKSLQDMLAEHEDEIRETFGDEIINYDKGEYNYYQRFIDIVDAIVAKIAERNGESKESVWDRFKRGMYRGEMTHLKEIETIYGKGSLRVLAALESGTRRSLVRDEVIEKLGLFFKTDNEQERNKLAQEVLNERERLRYDKRTQA